MSFLASLLALVNPLAAAPLFLRLTRNCAPRERHRIAGHAALTVIAVLAGAAWWGERVIGWLGVPLSGLQLTGGWVLAANALPMLQGETAAGPPEPQPPDPTARASVGVTPLAVPLLVGPATLALVIAGPAAGAPWRGLLHATAVGAAVYAALRGAAVLERALPDGVTAIASRLCGLLLVTLGVHAMASGIGAYVRAWPCG